MELAPFSLYIKQQVAPFRRSNAVKLYAGSHSKRHTLGNSMALSIADSNGRLLPEAGPWLVGDQRLPKTWLDAPNMHTLRILRSKAITVVRHIF